MKKHKLEIIIGLVALGLLIFRLCYLEHSMFFMLLSAALVILFGVYAIFIWKEKPRDEREELHARISDRYGLLVGGGVMLAIILYESVTYMPSPFVIISLLALVVGKIIGSIVAHSRH